MMKHAFAAFAATALVAMAAPTQAATVAGFDGNTVPACDDCFVGPAALGFSANFYGTTYANTFVSNNGYVTFGSGQGSFTPEGLGAGYAGLPIIAAFFTDLDTRSAPAGTSVTYGTGTFGGRNAFGVNYDRVGQFAQNYSALNTFQILLVDRGDTGTGNFDIVFNYDDIQFGRNASAGYNAGQPGNPAGTYYELPGSLSGEAFTNGGANSLVNNSNVGVDGRYVFSVRGGMVTPGVPEPGTWALLILGFGSIGAAMRRRSQAVRVSFA